MRYYFYYSIPVLQQMVILWAALSLLALPFVLLRYRRQGSFLSFRTAGFTAVVLLYAAGVIAYTLLPLPARDELVCTVGPTYPRFFLGWSLQFALRDHGGLLDALTSMYVMQVLLNVLLFVPLGVLARWRWGLSFTALLYTAFGCSLLIELTQLTGLWGFYDCAVRTFDAEDIFNNTLGAVLGWALVATWQHRARLRGDVLALLGVAPSGVLKK